MLKEQVGDAEIAAEPIGFAIPERSESFSLTRDLRGSAVSEARTVVMVDLREPTARLGAGERSGTPPLSRAEVASLLRLLEGGQDERARLLERLAVEQEANGEMRALFGQFLAAREQEKAVWQTERAELQTSLASAEAERAEASGRHQRTVADLVAVEERFRTHRANWVVERRRLNSAIEDLEGARGLRALLPRFLRRRR